MIWTTRLPLALLLAAGCLTSSARGQEAGNELFAEDEKPQAPATAVAEGEADETAQGAAGADRDGGDPQQAEEETDPRELAERAAELNRELRDVQTELRQLQMQGRQQGADAQELEGIILPDNPTRMDCEEYVKLIEEATQGQNSFSSGDPQVKMLASIPPEHVDLLVAQTDGRSSLRFHAQYAMREIDMSSLRSNINDLVLRQPAMIGVVVSYGWSQDAAAAIAAKLESRPPNLGMAWFQAAAELRDPSLYDAIHDCAVQSRYFTQIIQILEGIPDYDLQRTIGEMWRLSGEGNTAVNRYQVATVAVRFGYVDALGELINQLTVQSQHYRNNGENTYNTQRALVSRYICVNGTHEEIAQWFAENKDQLVFDYITERYLTPDQVEQF